ncbi:MAG TPA: 7-carboxy-7-deazaguanine synthase QueE [Polyangiaceae bacterium]
MSSPDRSFKVSEIFQSVQGEGPSAGLPCIFLRLATCNLRCAWCDTRYSWDFAEYDYAAEVTSWSLQALLERVVESGEPRLVVTGGEPLIQQDLLARLCDSLPPDLRVEIETNGTLVPNDSLCGRVDQWNVSPKLANSCETRERRFHPGALQRLRDTGRAWLKLVVAGEKDSLEAAELARVLGWPAERVMLMPLAASAEDLMLVGPAVVTAANNLGFRYSPRLHLELFGGQRGH